ncbi:LysM peptidoglycan-binding domain-containing protein [Spongiibacter tropicus]|uniref:LysM peptidoglycan-binding domain-containing protein n=1 Tax=Spongiibacter tropicus TaxID=454602 RepID=UPI003A993341
MTTTDTLTWGLNLARAPRLLIISLGVLLTACVSQPSRQQAVDYRASCATCTADRQLTVVRKTKAVAPEPLPSLPEYQDVWERIAAKLSFTDIARHARVEKLEDWYATHGHYMTKVSDRAGHYIYHIIEQLEARDMPVDLALLPFVESAYDPFAYSHGRAAGLWQFIPNTAKYVGIEQNWWYDGRRDVLVATDAALDYLSSLNQRFDGDWMLTLAAYNAGAGTVNKAIRRNKKKGRPTDFWSLDLPRETERYVPKLLALVKIFRNPASYNITLPHVEDAPRFAKINTGGQIDLAKAASLAGITVEELYRYNPGFNRWVTAPDGPHYLLIPTSNAAQFQTQLAALPEKQRVRWTRYKVAKGDNLISIAKRHHVDIASIRRFNELNSDMLRIGQELLIPGGSQSAPLDNLNRGVASSGRQQRKYTVRRGDTLSEIAKTHSVSVNQLIRWNRLDQGALIKPGQQLSIWTNASAPSGIVRKVGYKVRNGDSLSAIASRFKLKVADILEWNGIGRSSYLQPGQSLTLYVDVTRADL